MAKQPIAFIGVSRELKASATRGISTNTTVRVYRTNAAGKFDKNGWYETNPVIDGKISPASVIRAKRAQLVLAERAQKENAQ